MKTEQDIKKFMQENRIPVPKDNAFMDELVRQINLLPTPASLADHDAKVKENIRMLTAVMDVVRKYNRKQIVRLAVVNVITCISIFIAGYFLLTPQILTGESAAVVFIIQWRHVLMGFICLAAIAATVSRSDIVRI